MSIRVMTWVWENARDVSGNDLVVLLALADHANDQGEAWPSIPRLAQKARISVRSVHNVTARLQEQGYITVEQHIGRGNTNRYTVQMLHVLAPETVQDLHGSEEENMQPATQIVQNGARKHAIAVAPEPSEREPSFRTIRESGVHARAPTRERRPLIPIPSEWDITEEDEVWLKEHGATLKWAMPRTELFVTHYESIEDTQQVRNSMEGWKSAWQKWMLKDLKEEATRSLRR